MNSHVWKCQTHGEWPSGLDRMRELHQCKLHYLPQPGWPVSASGLSGAVVAEGDLQPAPELQAFEEHLLRIIAEEGGCG